MHTHNTTRAFTLIDILVSVSIISFLSSIVMFNVTEGRTKAQDAQMKIESAQVSLAVEMFKLDNEGKTPISVKAQQFSDQGISTGKMYQETDLEYRVIMQELVNEGYLSEIPTSPDGDSYAYGETTDGTQAMFVAELSSESNISGNTQNSCEDIVVEPVVEEPEPIPWMPPPCQVPLSKDPAKQELCPAYGLELTCTQYPEEGYMECSYIIPTITNPDDGVVYPLCSGENNEDYCTCI